MGSPTCPQSSLGSQPPLGWHRWEAQMTRCTPLCLGDPAAFLSCHSCLADQGRPPSCPALSLIGGLHTGICFLLGWGKARWNVSRTDVGHFPHIWGANDNDTDQHQASRRISSSSEHFTKTAPSALLAALRAGGIVNPSLQRHRMLDSLTQSHTAHAGGPSIYS